MLNIGSAYHMYMMESEGMEDQVTTRRTKILAAANEVRDRQLDCFNDIYVIAANHGVDMNSLSQAELYEFERRAGLR